MEEPMTTNIVIELAIGKVKQGISRQDYLKAATAVESDLRTMPGFLSRRLLAGEDGLWVDLVMWDSMQEALQAAQIFKDLPSGLPMIEMLDGDSVRMYHLEPVYEDELPMISRDSASS
jgi:hypothetical protein